MPLSDLFRRTRIWQIPLIQIEATVSAHLGPGRVPGNERGPCFSPQVSMYLAKHIGGWGTTRIGKFYNGRHHTTVVHAIEKIELLRKHDEPVDALLEVLSAALVEHAEARWSAVTRANWPDSIIDAVAHRVMERMDEALDAKCPVFERLEDPQRRGSRAIDGPGIVIQRMRPTNAGSATTVHK